jgi:hypothetical protein
MGTSDCGGPKHLDIFVVPVLADPRFRLVGELGLALRLGLALGAVARRKRVVALEPIVLDLAVKVAVIVRIVGTVADLGGLGAGRRGARCLDLLGEAVCGSGNVPNPAVGGQTHASRSTAVFLLDFFFFLRSLKSRSLCE